MAGRHRVRTWVAGLTTAGLTAAGGVGLIVNGASRTAVSILLIFVGFVVCCVLAVVAGVIFSSRPDPVHRLVHLVRHLRKPEVCRICVMDAERLGVTAGESHSEYEPHENDVHIEVSRIHQRRRLHPNG